MLSQAGYTDDCWWLSGDYGLGEYYTGEVPFPSHHTRGYVIGTWLTTDDIYLNYLVEVVSARLSCDIAVSHSLLHSLKQVTKYGPHLRGGELSSTSGEGRGYILSHDWEFFSSLTYSITCLHFISLIYFILWVIWSLFCSNDQNSSAAFVGSAFKLTSG